MKTLLVALSCLALGMSLARPVHAQLPTLDSLWPNDDGHAWNYDLHYVSEDPVPSAADYQIRLFFDGETVAPDGIVAQYLRQQTLGGPAVTVVAASQIDDPFLRQVWVARPDLQAKILRAVADHPCPLMAPTGVYAILLGGEFAYRKTADEIAAWRCNAANTRAWQWLVSDLTLGNTFTLRLLPDLADDLFLHGTIAAIEPVTVPAGTFADCVRVDYVVDYGTSQCTDAGGNLSGTFRDETQGHVHYAPGIGPVESSEQFVTVESSGSCEPLGVHALTSLGLSSATVPVRSISWGRLKTVYR